MRRGGLSHGRGGRGGRRWLPVLACALPPFAGLLLALDRFLPHPDVAFYITAARQLAEGGRLYLDVGDVNQPSIYWLHLAAHRLAEALGIADRGALALLLLLASWSGLLLTGRLLRDFAAPAAWGFLFAAACGLGLLALDIHGEREQWAIAGFLPWTAAAALRLAGGRPPLWAAALAGLLAGAAATLKLPYLLLPLLSLEVLLLWRRAARPWRAEVLVGALAAIGLFGLELLLHPAYLERVLPEALTYYRALEGSPWAQLARKGVLFPLAILLAASVCLRLLRPRPAGERDSFRSGSEGAETAAWALSAAALATAGGFLAAFLLQAKGFAYHWLPVLAFGLAAVGALLPALARLGGAPRFLAPPLLALLPAWCLFLAWQQLGAAPAAWEDARALARELAARGEAAGRPPLVYGLAPELYPLFPAVTLAGARWAMAESHLWQLDGLYRLSPAMAEPAGFRPPPRQGEAEAALRRRLVERFLASRPDLVALFAGREATLGGSSFSYLDYLRADRAFAAAWEDYRFAGRIGHYLLFERRRQE